MKKVLIIALAYFGVTVGAGFASGQEMLQYYVSYGWWGIAGAGVVLVLMPVTAMVILQYGSYFRAQSHGLVFCSITSAVMARFLDYSLSISQFCIGFVMLAGAGANLNQQFGLPLWVGSTLMVVLVLAAGMANVDKVTNLIGGITPFMVLILLAAAIYGVANPPADIAAAGATAEAVVESPLPNWWLSTLNYLGVSMFSGIAMAILIGGDNWNPRTAGRGGFVGGLMFGGILVLMGFALIFQIDSVADADLPTLALVNEMSPALGLVASVATYLMIFSTSLGVFYSLGKRISVATPGRYRLIFIVVTLVGYALSFFDFTLLVANVFPVLGWLGVILVIVLLVSWLSKGRRKITAESRRRDKIRALILRRIDPKGKFTREDRVDFAEAQRDSSVKKNQANAMRDEITQEVVDELDSAPDSGFEAEDFNAEKFWAGEKRRPLMKGEVRVVSESAPRGWDESPQDSEANDESAGSQAVSGPDKD